MMLLNALCWPRMGLAGDACNVGHKRCTSKCDACLRIQDQMVEISELKKYVTLFQAYVPRPHANAICVRAQTKLYVCVFSK